MNLVTLVNTNHDGKVILGHNHKINLKAVKFDQGKLLILTSNHLNEEVRLVPYQ